MDQLKPCPFSGKLVSHMEINVLSAGRGFLSIICYATMTDDFAPGSRHEQTQAQVGLIERWNKRHGAQGE